MSWHPQDSGVLLGAMAKKPSRPRHTPAKSSTPSKQEQEQHPQLRAEHKESDRRIKRNMKAIADAQKRRDLHDPTAGNGQDRGEPTI